MLTYSLEERGELPIYEFLYRKIKEDILSGKLAAGEKLPSKRSLARNLQIGVITVENAYAQLLMEGYLYSREKEGIMSVNCCWKRQTGREKAWKNAEKPMKMKIRNYRNIFWIFPVTVFCRKVSLFLCGPG